MQLSATRLDGKRIVFAKALLGAGCAMGSSGLLEQAFLATPVDLSVSLISAMTMPQQADQAAGPMREGASDDKSGTDPTKFLRTLRLTNGDDSHDQ